MMRHVTLFFSSRYEADELAIAEAPDCGVPAVVSTAAGPCGLHSVRQS